VFEVVRRVVEGAAAAWPQLIVQLDDQRIDLVDPAICSLKDLQLASLDVDLENVDLLYPKVAQDRLNAEGVDRLISGP
jgi:hypothetical protein